MERPRNFRRRAEEMNVDSRIRENDIGSDNLWVCAESGCVAELGGDVCVDEGKHARRETGTCCAVWGCDVTGTEAP